MDSGKDRSIHISRIGLGTAQFGMAYGATNRHGKLSVGEVAAILECARQKGISFLDTAPAYGTSEELLGSLPETAHFFMGTKTSASLSNPEEIRRGLQHSLAKLSRNSVEILLVHHADILRGKEGKAYWKALQRSKAEGLVRKIGISLYDVLETMELVERYAPDVVQIPLNPLDQRFLREGTLQGLAARGVEVHVRSIFLQGTLLASPKDLPEFLHREPFERWRTFCEDHAWSPLEGALGFALGCSEISQIICGVTSVKELEDLLEAVFPLDPLLFAHCHEEKPFVRDPRLWR